MAMNVIDVYRLLAVEKASKDPMKVLAHSQGK
jgi:hypothetical protein